MRAQRTQWPIKVSLFLGPRERLLASAECFGQLLIPHGIQQLPQRRARFDAQLNEITAADQGLQQGGFS